MSEEGAGTSWLTCWYATESGVSPRNGWRPVSSSKSITPAEYTSPRGPVTSPATCSGGTYATVPMSSPALVWPAAACALARPKSATLTRPSAVSRTFSGLTSRCTMPDACAAARPSRTPVMMSRAAAGENHPRSLSSCLSVRPWMYSMARYRKGPSAPWS